MGYSREPLLRLSQDILTFVIAKGDALDSETRNQLLEIPLRLHELVLSEPSSKNETSIPKSLYDEIVRGIKLLVFFTEHLI